MATLDVNQIGFEKKSLHTPTLQQVANALTKGLPSNFENVHVDVVECPNLTEQPFTLACKGLNGHANLIEIGGPPYLLPLVQRNKIYDIKEIACKLDTDPVCLMGAGAGPFMYAGTNCEGMLNICVGNGSVTCNNSYFAKVDAMDPEKYALEKFPRDETRCALLANLYSSNGLPGKVVKVSCKKRTGQDDFITSIRKALKAEFGDMVVGLGGTFVLKKGKAKLHIMPDFSKTPITSDAGVNDWLKFFVMSAPLVSTGTLVTDEHGLDLRLQHFHCFSHHGQGGHYHYDTTPEEVEYEGYFNVAENIYRVDRPVSSHKFGRD